MHRRLGALMGMIGFILVAGYWVLRAMSALLDQEAAPPDMPPVGDILLRALAAMVFCFLIGWMLSRHGVRLLDEAREQAEGTMVGLDAMPPADSETPSAPTGPQAPGATGGQTSRGT